MTKKRIIILLSVCALLSSCSLGVGRTLSFDDSHKKADARMEQVIETIKNKDKDALKAMFTVLALSESDDIDKDLEALFQYVQGSIESWESTGAYHGEEKRDSDGINNKKEIESTYIIKTSEGEYKIAIYENRIDTANPDNVGVYSLCIINTKDHESKHVYWGNGEIGINIG